MNVLQRQRRSEWGKVLANSLDPDQAVSIDCHFVSQIVIIHYQRSESFFFQKVCYSDPVFSVNIP